MQLCSLNLLLTGWECRREPKLDGVSVMLAVSWQLQPPWLRAREGRGVSEGGALGVFYAPGCGVHHFQVPLGMWGCLVHIPACLLRRQAQQADRARLRQCVCSRSGALPSFHKLK